METVNLINVQESKREKPKASTVDILRVCAVLGCMWQALIVLLSKGTTGDDFTHGIMFETIVKYTAATFIFANVFDLAKLRNIKYGPHMKTKIKNIIIPYILWTLVYMYIYMFLLQTSNYKNIWDILQAMIFGTAAPNLWYTVMMFQFELLVIPIILISQKIQKNKKLVPVLLIIAFIAYFIFLYIYDTFAFKTTNVYLSYMDRTFIMYSIYGVLGIVAATYEDKWNKFIDKVKYLAIPCIVLVYAISISMQFSKNPISFDNISYLTPIMFAYNVLMIIILYALARGIIKYMPKTLTKLKWLNTYAFRTYLSYIVYLYFSVYIVFGSRIDNIPYIVKLILVYAMTATLTYLSSFVLHVARVSIWQGLKALVTGKKADIQCN